MPEGERIPEATRLKTSEARERYLRDIYEKSKGTDVGSDIVFFHGTSIEALEHAIEKGTLPGQSGHSTHHQPGSLFVYPIVDRIPTKRASSAWLRDAIPHGEEEPVVGVEGYAKYAAERHFVLTELSIPIADEQSEGIVQHFLYGDSPSDVGPELGGAMRGFLEAHGEEIVYTILNKAKERKGVVLGLKRSAFKNKHATEGLGLGDPGEGDMKLLTGAKGLGLEHIGHIQALGEDGKLFFESLAETR